jgi:hypothetical protein
LLANFPEQARSIRKEPKPNNQLPAKSTSR